MDQETKEQSSNPRSPNELDSRYGKIGISAVAAAVRRQPEQRQPVNNTRFVPDRD
ncbi:hypothetical protein MXD81_07610 [Microbacteriaceae bacterium K1510]|nr:hypothetical protein [Microbacteriaceae bacterium K1510]